MRITPPRKTREQWADIIEQQNQSGLTAELYCQQHEIGMASFSKWKRRLIADKNNAQRPVNSSAFKPVNIVDTSESKVNNSAPTITLSIGSSITPTITNTQAPV